MNGYSHPAYASSLAEFGTPRHLPRSDGWLLERSIPDTPYRDAMGCYPLFACQDWAKLEADLNEIAGDLVSVALVADPFGNHDPTLLRRCFLDRVTPFKEHLVTDLSRLPESFVAAQHRRKALRALERLTVERCESAMGCVDEWNKLYANLIKRHDIRGLSAFSETSFKAQLAVPGISIFRAVHEDETIGMTLWYVDRGVAYYHLGAYSDVGYELEASFAIFWQALDYFSKQSLQWLDLGAGAGLSSDGATDGLARFKRGWANASRTAYFCGRIFDHSKYEEAMRAQQITSTDYFPAYRRGEFG
jgi:GNAT acetyltransferase-like protein